MNPAKSRPVTLLNIDSLRLLPPKFRNDHNDHIHRFLWQTKKALEKNATYIAGMTRFFYLRAIFEKKLSAGLIYKLTIVIISAEQEKNLGHISSFGHF